MGDTEKRALLAVALSGLVFLGYTQLMKTMYPAPPASEQVQTETTISGEAASASLPASAISASAKDETIQSAELGPYGLDYSVKHAELTEVRMLDFKDGETEKPIWFIDTLNPNQGVGAMDLWVDGQPVKAEFVEEPMRGGLGFASSAADLEISKAFLFQAKKFDQKLILKITNHSEKSRTIRFRLLSGSGVVVRNSIDHQYIETNWINADAVEHVKAGKDKSKASQIPYAAVSVKSRHFSSIIKSNTQTYVAATEGFAKENMGAYLVSGDLVLAPGAAFTEEFMLFIGPNKFETLEPLGLASVIHYGKLDPICKLLVGGMQMVYKFTRNYGVAIILLTILLNILLLPLTRASFMSMKRMQLVQPETARLREKYKNDPQRMNKEMMELYRKHKVNPMGGCLPMLAQSPIFISLYVALCKSTELLGAKFLWVDDLASPDKVKLPFTLPILGSAIHVLPLIMVAAMVIQQRISASQMPQTDPNVAKQQKMMMTFMPILFGFMFYPMPSGLVLYWLTNTITMGLYQAWLRRAPVVDVVRHPS